MTKLDKILKQYFGYDGFRNGQEEIINTILACRDVLAVMPTGGGKSLCYQLPAIVMHGTVLVVSPLISLMKDQVDYLNSCGVNATSIDSTIGFEELRVRFQHAANSKYQLIYVAPERLGSKIFLNLLKTIHIPFIAIDEAHCISEWGHDFRPSYLNINNIFNHIERCPIIALTATATPEVQRDIAEILKLHQPKIVVKGFDRKNLSYFTEYCTEKALRIADICSRTKSGSTIVYAGSRKKVELMSKELNECGIKSEPYHAGMKTLLRSAIQDRFINGRTPVIVATNAFGMGIDKYDVRNVIHIDFPLTIESYYQEAGRAGRDGKPSDCYILYNELDESLPEYYIQATYPSENIIRRVYDAIDAHIRKTEFSPERLLSIPEPVNLANEINLDYLTVESVYKLFIRNGIISSGKVMSSARIRITTSRERIMEYYNNLNPEKQQSLEAILRSSSSDIFDRFVNINIRDILQKHGISRQQYDDIVKSLQMLNLASYFSDQEAGSYSLSKFFGSFDDLPLDMSALRTRYAFALAKFDKVIEYTHTKDCKRNFILNYFEDEEFDDKCKKCVSCKEIKIKNYLLTSYHKFLEKVILGELSNFESGVDSNKLMQNIMAFVSSTPDATYDNAANNRIDIYYNKAIQNLLQRRIIKYKDRFNKTISITPEGEEFIKQIPEQINLMARREKEKTESEIIFSKLVTLRREIAEHAGVVPRGIISDVALRKIAEVMPSTEYDLKNVSGVSQLFVQKFAKLFLQELAKIKLNPKEQKVSKVAQDTLRMLEQGSDFETIKTRLFAGNLAMMANYIVEIIEAGQKLPRKQLVPDAVYTKVKAAIKKFPDLGARDIQPKLTIEIDSPTLKIACAFAKAELGLL